MAPSARAPPSPLRPLRPPGPPLRAPLACLACREGKTRCTGLIPPHVLLLPSNKHALKDQPALLADTPCPRCVQHGLPCLWKPCSRTGRPRKRARCEASPAEQERSRKHGQERSRKHGLQHTQLLPGGDRRKQPCPASPSPTAAAPAAAPPAADPPVLPAAAPAGPGAADWPAWAAWELDTWAAALWPPLPAGAQRTCDALCASPNPPLPPPPPPATTPAATGVNAVAPSPGYGQELGLLHSLFWPTPDTFVPTITPALPVVGPTSPSASSPGQTLALSPERASDHDHDPTAGSAYSSSATSAADPPMSCHGSRCSPPPGLATTPPWPAEADHQGEPSSDLFVPAPAIASGQNVNGSGSGSNSLAAHPHVSSPETMRAPNTRSEPPSTLLTPSAPPHMPARPDLSAPSPIPPTVPAEPGDKTHRSHRGGQSNPVRALYDRINSASKPSSAPPTTTTPAFDDEIELGVERFFTSFALSLPILGRQGDFMAWPERSLTTLAIAFMGHTSIRGTEAAVTVKALSQTETEWCRTTQGFHWGVLASLPATALDVLASTLVLAYGNYGCHALSKAEMYMSCFLQLAISCGLTQLDQQEASHDFVVWMRNIGMTEVGRRLWSEFFAADVMMHISTSGKVKRQFVPAEHEIVHIHSAKDVGFEDDPDDSDAACRARTSAVVLMYECVRAPRMGQSGAPRMECLLSLDGMIQNLVSDIQQAWLACVRSPPSETREYSDATGRSAAIDALRAHGSRQAILFDSLVAAYACRIHLHRRAWFGDLPLDLESCSFKWQDEPGYGGPSSHLVDDCSGDDAHAPYVPDLKALQNSVLALVEAADKILLLTRLDSQQAMERATAQSANPSELHFMPIHWPIWGCCQMVASYAYVVMVAAGDSQAQLTTPPAVASATKMASSSGGKAGLCCGADFGTEGRMCSPRTDANSPSLDQRRWRIREAVSNMAFCEATLGHGSKVFPIYRLFRSEIHSCRLAVDSSMDQSDT